MACSQTVGANLCQRHRVRENLSTDSIVYKQAESVYLSILILRRKDLCTCIYCYLVYMVSFVLWLTGIPGPQEKEVS